MGWTPTVFTAGGLIAGVISAVLVVVGWRSRSRPYAGAFTALMFALGAWSLAYGVQLGFDTTAAGLPYQRLASAAGAAVPTLWFVFALQYAGFDEWLTRRWLAVLAAEPLAFAGLAVTNSRHELIWTITRTPTGVETSLTVLGDGHAVYSYVLSSVAILALVVVALTGSVVYRRQAALLVCGAGLPLAANVAFIGGITARDLTPFAYAGTGLIWGLGLFELDLLNRGPIAHQRAITEVGDGLVVFDTDGTVVRTEGVARSAFDPPLTVGDSVERLVADGGLDRSGLELSPGSFQSTDGLAATLAAVDNTTQRAVVDGRQRAYDLRVSSIDDHHGRDTGYVLVVRDVTRREAYQQRLEVSNRVLRHNLRNDMNVVAGHAESISQTAERLCRAEQPSRDDAESIRSASQTIGRTATRLLDTSRKARTMSQLSRAEPGVVEIVEPTRDVVESFREQRPAATIELDAPDAVAAVVGGRDRYRTALRNLIENAIRHHDATPTVVVTVDPTDTVTVSVADDGPGVPEAEREPFAVGAETDLQHASGLGLWLVYWVTTGVGGDLDFRDRDPRGTVVTMSFPADDTAS